MSLYGSSAVELFNVTDPWTTQSLSEVLINKYGRGGLETKSGYQVFLSDERLTAQQMDDLVFCSAYIQGITHVQLSNVTCMLPDFTCASSSSLESYRIVVCVNS